jgi:glycosyltransferase involved in cell wall biosynthesis
VNVSIVTPSYNQAAFLAETIESVLAQDYPAIEYVVVDDGSTDGSIEIARRYEPRLNRLLVQENAGQVAAVNAGFRETDGELMAFLNSDDTLLPGAVAEMAAEFDADPSLVLVYGDALYTDAESNRTGYLTSREWDPPTMVSNCDNHVVQPSSMWRRSAWEVAGPFDPRAHYFFDFELYLRLSELGRVKRVAKAWSTYRVHTASKTGGDQRGKAYDYLRFADEFLRGDRLPESLRPYVRRGRARARVAAAANLYGWRLDPRSARRWLWEALAIDPAGASWRSVSLALRSLVPSPIVRRVRGVARGARGD